MLEETDISSDEFVIEEDLDIESFSEEDSEWDLEENFDDDVIFADDPPEG